MEMLRMDYVWEVEGFSEDWESKLIQIRRALKCFLPQKITSFWLSFLWP